MHREPRIKRESNWQAGLLVCGPTQISVNKLAFFNFQITRKITMCSSSVRDFTRIFFVFTEPSTSFSLGEGSWFTGVKGTAAPSRSVTQKSSC